MESAILKSILLTPTGCPTIPFNSDTHHSELPSDLTSQGQVPHETALLQMAAADGIPKLPGLLSNLATNLGLPPPTTSQLLIYQKDSQSS